ncbi:hypothetical protein F511_20494 [Dorcoceras hygrometricum]|uniref:Uncharacterized protein n=1 Tax=Dorcoceras hygrometricum TaxID=472368 RepID=A0A2Z7BFN9_9LAMI|nr:hypothetical protein F511_20494 [Dorcoceras hygrometricum]
METGIDQMNLHSVQLGYLKILQVGNTDPNNNKSRKTNTSKSAGGNHRSVVFRVRQPITARWSSDTTNQSVTTPMIALDFSGTTNQSLKSTSTDSHKGMVQTTEASQLPPATKFTVGTPWNSNVHQVSNNQLNSNSTSKVLRSSSIINYRILQSTSQLLNLARNHLPKISQHPKNALSDFSRNLRTPAASRSNSQVVLQPLMGNNRKNKSQGFQRPPKSLKSSTENGDNRWEINHGEQ